MKEVLSWIVDNYELIILVGACLLDIILFLFGVFRKKKDLSLDEMLIRVPHLVSLAEDKFGAGKGDLKFRYVIDILCAMYEEDTGVKVTPDSKVYGAFNKAIEKVLEAPQKKGK